jgi:hypothetical protein
MLRSTKTIRRPSPASANGPAQLEGAVTGSGSPRGSPVAAVSGRRQRLSVPPRVEAK